MSTIYKAMYLHLFNAVTDALLEPDGGDPITAVEHLKSAQSECEEIFLSSSEQDQEAADHP